MQERGGHRSRAGGRLVRVEGRSATVGGRLTDAFLACDALAMVVELAPDEVFHSAIADYEGRDRIRTVLTAVTASAVSDCETKARAGRAVGAPRRRTGCRRSALDQASGGS